MKILYETEQVFLRKGLHHRILWTWHEYMPTSECDFCISVMERWWICFGGCWHEPSFLVLEH